MVRALRVLNVPGGLAALACAATAGASSQHVVRSRRKELGGKLMVMR
jgi:hypothetical protein